MPLRYYQQEAKEAIQYALCEYDRVLLAMGTGGGKTVIAAHLIQDFLPSRCLFLADQDELCTQPLTVINRETHIIPALEKGKDRANLQAKVVVGSSQTMMQKNRLEAYPPKWFDYAIVDEAHRGRKRDRKILEHVARKVIGMTATPFTVDLKTLSDDYDEVAYQMPMAKLINEGFASPWRLIRLPVEIDLSNVATSRLEGSMEYDADSLSTTIAPYYERILQLLKEHANDRKIGVFLPLIKSSEAFAAMARRIGFTAMHVDGKSEDRNEIIERFRNGGFQMITCSNLLTTGVDIPIADCFVPLTPMRSPIKYQQAFGRFERLLPGVIDHLPGKWQVEERKLAIAASDKPDTLIVDFLWQHDKLNVYKPENMIAASAEEAAEIFERVKQMKSPADIMAIQKLVQEEREAAIVKKLEEVAMRTTTNRVAPTTFGFLIGSHKLMEYEPVSGWELDRPSAAQLARLEEYGIDIGLVKSKGLAVKLMDACIHRARFRLASVNQLHALSQAKIKHDPKRITGREANRLLSETHLRLARAA